MAIRVRKVNIGKVNEKLVALCAAESVPGPDDLYLDDNVHHALSEKFTADFKKMGFFKSKDEMRTKDLIQQGLIPAQSLIGIISVVGDDETATNLEKNKKYRFSESELIDLIESIKQENNE